MSTTFVSCKLPASTRTCQSIRHPKLLVFDNISWQQCPLSAKMFKILCQKVKQCFPAHTGPRNANRNLIGQKVEDILVLKSQPYSLDCMNLISNGHIFLLKFQSPIICTLCFGDLWSILVVTPAHSADPRSRLAMCLVHQVLPTARNYEEL